MKKLIAIALLCMAVPSSGFSQVYDIAKGAADLESAARETSDIEDDYMESEIALRRAQEEALYVETERLRLENELLRYEYEQRQQEAERQRAQAAAQSNETKGIDQSASPDMYEQLRIIGQLRDDGILTEEEFQEQKKKILNQH